jgi:hypothetical protein
MILYSVPFNILGFFEVTKQTTLVKARTATSIIPVQKTYR